MRNFKLIPAIILIGFGVYYYFQQIGVTLFANFHSWPTLLAIVGSAFLVHGYWGKNYESILPGVILFGFGIHLHIVDRLQIWPDHLGAFLLIISLGFLLRYQKVGTGLVYGILFLILSGFLLFYDEVTSKIGNDNNVVAFLLKNWPIVLILLGIYLLIKKGK